MPAKKKLPKLNAPLEGGYYAGRINVDGVEYALIVAPKATGERAPTPWNEKSDNVKGALSLCDGLANTKAMAKAGSDVAKWALGLKIGKHRDWYIPSQDELEICYRAFKPTTDANSLYARSGINVSAVPPTYPYFVNPVKQTKDKKFQAGGVEAFEPNWYWTSTQHAGVSACAWYQYFGSGLQGYVRKSINDRVRAVRKIKI